MVDPDIVEYVRRHSGKFTPEQIRGGLTNAGVPPAAIDEAFRLAAARPLIPDAPKPSRKGRKIVIGLLIGGAILVAGGVMAVRFVRDLLQSPEFLAKLREMQGIEAGRRPGGSPGGRVAAGGGFQTYITLALRAYNKGDKEEAVRLATQAMNEDVPESHAAAAKKGSLAIRAHCYEQLGRHAEALADYTAMLELDPKDSDGHYGRGRVYAAMKDYPRALAEAAKMIALAPQRPEGYAIEAGAYASTGKPKKAVAKYSEAIRLEEKAAAKKKEKKQLAGWYFNRGVMLANSGERAKALSDMARAAELDPKEPHFRKALARMYAAAGKSGKAEAESAEALRLEAEGDDGALRLGPSLPSLPSLP